MWKLYLQLPGYIKYVKGHATKNILLLVTLTVKRNMHFEKDKIAYFFYKKLILVIAAILVEITTTIR